MPSPRPGNDPFPAADQRALLLAAKAWWLEGDRSLDYLAEKSRQETLLKGLRPVVEAFRAEPNPTGQQVAAVVRVARRATGNPALNRTLESEAFAASLRKLLFGAEGLPERLAGFLANHRIGPLTASHLLYATAPERFPLVNPRTRAVLAPTNAQRTKARQAVLRAYTGPLSDLSREALELLTDFQIYEAAFRLIGVADYTELHGVLLHAPEMPAPARRKTRETGGGRGVGRLREKGAGYGADVTPSEEARPDATETDLLRWIEGSVAAQGFHFPPLAVRNYYVALKAKPFALLTGLSGTGKTRLTRLFADALVGEALGQYLLVPVRPDWADGSALLGYYNLLTDRYVGTPFLQLLTDAARPENAGRAYFVCLDEMNLSSPNHYLSDILSIMEASDKTLSLHEGRAITLPSNVFLTGTLNIDEASHPISKKVLDRANTIEFTDVSFEEEARVALTVLPQIPSPDRQRLFLENRVTTLEEARARLEVIHSAFSSKVIAMLSEANNILVERTLHFAYRVRDEVMRYVAASFYQDGRGILVEEPGANLQVAFDLQMMQKVLPRVTGTTESLERLLLDLESWAVRENLPRSAAKIARMRRRASEEGFVTFYDV
jgi:MoxR-like ATPase